MERRAGLSTSEFSTIQPIDEPRLTVSSVDANDGGCEVLKIRGSSWTA
jgi:hypothetical protein